ncbi:MAG TPA: response regulator transcription factor [Candidatus Acidoferrum sp.]
MAIRVLIVDDSDITRRLLRAIVRSRRWTICGEAENGTSGVVQFQDLKPDVVLLDLSLPDVTGIEVAKLMGSLEPKIPIILFTILDIEGIEAAAKEAGIKAVVPKSQAWDLISTIETEVGRSRAARA